MTLGGEPAILTGMARVTFEADDKHVDANVDDWLYDVCTDAGASIPFSCKAGACGTCATEVVGGADGLGRFQFRPGQYMVFQVPSPDGREVVRRSLARVAWRVATTTSSPACQLGRKRSTSRVVSGPKGWPGVAAPASSSAARNAASSAARKLSLIHI